MSSFSPLHWAVVGIIFYVLFRAVSGLFGGKGKPMHCLDCGSDVNSHTHTPGNTLIEIILWLCFIIPGLIYSIWRISARKPKCPACESLRVIPPNSPAAVAHRLQLGNKN